MKEKKVETIKIEEKETNMINGMQNNVNERLFIEPKQYKGVTLVALVVTIVVLLILAGVTIGMLRGDTGNAKLILMRS